VGWAESSRPTFKLLLLALVGLEDSAHPTGLKFCFLVEWGPGPRMTESRYFRNHLLLLSNQFMRDFEADQDLVAERLSGQIQK
jgi:hypothetical protein